MSAIEVGMYVRTKYGIAKILSTNYTDDIVEDFLVVDKELEIGLISGCDWHLCDKKDVINSSFNIIDLIEVGDILHSKNDKQYWTVENYLYEKGRCVNIEWKVLDSNEEFLENIDEIITKEQAKSVSYKVGE